MAANLVDSLFGPTPYDIGQSRNQQDMSYAEKVARMNGFEQAKFGIGQGAAGLTRAGAGMLGMVDPLQEEAKMREGVMGMGGDLTTSQGLKAKAMQFAQAGDQRTAMKLVIAARQMEEQEAERKYKNAQALKLESEAREGKSPFAKINPKDYTPASLKVFVKTGDPADLVADDKGKRTTDDVHLGGGMWQTYEVDSMGNVDYSKPRGKPFDKKPTASSISATASTGKGDSKYAEKRLSDAAETLTALGKSAESAWKANQALDRFAKASAGGSQGGAQPLITATQNLLSSFGYTADALKDTRQMEQAIGDILGNKMAELGARGLTDKDMEVLRQSLPRVDTDKASRDNVVEILQKANNNVLLEYENARAEEARVYPELSKRITDPGWYKAFKASPKKSESRAEKVSQIPTESKEMSSMPSPAEYSGKIVKDTVTGKRYKSDGTKWVLQ